MLAQTLREWSANASQAFEYLAVCSDQTVVGEDEFVQHPAELGFPVTTDPEMIASFLRRRGRRVVFATYQSSPQIASAYRNKIPQFDLAIADEAHRCAGRASTEFATILDSGKIRSRRRLFMTATPRFYTPRLRKEAGLLDVEVASMDDERVFGPVLHRLTFGEAIERDLLSDYQVVVVGVDNATYRAWAERGEFVTPDGKKVTDARTLAGQIALARAMRKYDLRRVISFHGRVNAARKFSDDMPYVSAWMPARARPRQAIWNEHVSGAMSSGHRDRLLLRFRNLGQDEIGLLSNARCLGEGVDVPSLDGVVFIDPRRSTLDIIQAVGRAIRKAPGKTLGTIVLPVFVGEEDPEQTLDDSAFQNIWEVLKALRAHDEKLGEELDELRRNLGSRRLPPRRPRKIKLDVPIAVVGASFAKAFNVRLVERTTGSSEFSFGRLLSFVEREGHSRVISDVARLEALPGWVWDSIPDKRKERNHAAWEKAYAKVIRFVKENGHARVPVAQYDDEGIALGLWVRRQRAFHGKGQLAKERVQRLEALTGWVWDSNSADWEDGYAHLLRFVQREKHSRVSWDYCDDDGYRLGNWVHIQRQTRKRGELSKSRAQRLEDLPGWVWAAREANWDDGYARLVRFVKREGHARPRALYRDEDGYGVGMWVVAQRQTAKAGKLDPIRAQRLDELPSWTWDARKLGRAG